MTASKFRPLTDESRRRMLDAGFSAVGIDRYERAMRELDRDPNDAEVLGPRRDAWITLDDDHV